MADCDGLHKVAYGTRTRAHESLATEAKWHSTLSEQCFVDMCDLFAAKFSNLNGVEIHR